MCAVVGDDEDQLFELSFSLSWKRAVASKLRYVVGSSKGGIQSGSMFEKRCRSLCLVPVGIVGNSDANIFRKSEAQGNQTQV